LNWNWEPRTWKPSIKILLGLVTIWPIIYMGLFMVAIFGGFFFSALMSQQSERQRSTLDLIQLERKIQNSEIVELKVSATEIEAIDRNGRHFETDVSNESTREEIIRLAREFDSNHNPRVSKIVQNSSEPRINRAIPFGFAVFIMMHMGTILLMFVLMPLYILLAVKDESHDQTMKIVWIVLMATTGILVMPVYWYLYIWRKPPSAAAVPKTL
jgi:hypothetical protein